MIDKILPDRVVAVEGEGDFELGAHAVRAGDEHGLAEFSGVEGEKAAEAAHLTQDLAAAGGGQQLGQGGLDLVTKGNIDSSRGVCFLTHVPRNLPGGAGRDKR